VRKATVLLLTAFFVLKSAPAALAAADFYGVKISSESYAKGLWVDESGSAPKFTVEKPGMDKRVFAYGNWAGFLGTSKGISIQVFNNSDQAITTHYDFAEYTVVTQDGERHSMSPPAMVFPSIESIEPKKSAVFEPVFDGGGIKKEDIRMIICSFDLGDTKIILLPLSKKLNAHKPENETAKLVLVEKPKPVSAAPAKTTQPPSLKPSKPKEFVSRPAPKPKNVESKSKSVLKSIVESLTRPAAPKPATLKENVSPEPKISTKHENLPYRILEEEETPVPAVPKKKIQNKIYKKKALWPFKKTQETQQAKVVPEKPFKSRKEKGMEEIKEKYMEAKLAELAAPRPAPKVQKWDKEFGFIVVNRGAIDGVKKDSVLSVAREGRLISKAVVHEVRDDYSAALVLSDWAEEEIQVDDDILVGDFSGG